MLKQTFRREVPAIDQAVQTVQTGSFKLTSPVFESGALIPQTYTCKGADINPPLTIENAPGNAKEFVLIAHDPDAPSGDPVHWTLWNIPVTTTTIAEHSIPENAVQGANDFGKGDYSGPCPATGTGTRNYVFELYALNDSIVLDATTKRDGIVSAMNGKVISRTQLTGTVAADPKP